MTHAQAAKITKPSAFMVAPPPADSLRRGWSLWLWPGLAVTAIAIAGQLFGSLGALIALGQSIAGAFFITGRLLDRPTRLRASLLAIATGGTAVLVLTAPLHSRARGVPPDTGPVDLNGRTVTTDQVTRLNLRGSLLAGAQLDHVDLRNNSLAGATVIGASLVGARLDGVNLRGADLRGANLTRACLHGADLTGAILNGTTVDDADLSNVILPANASSVWTGRPTQPGAPKQCS